MVFRTRMSVSGKKTKDSLENIMSDDPIYIPRHPLWNILQDFGTDELLVTLCGVAGTALVTYLTTQFPKVSSVDLPVLGSAKDVLLSVAGPVLEKVGFYPIHLYKEMKESKEKIHFLEFVKKQNLTSKNKKDLYFQGIKKALQHGTLNASKDLTQDALYTAMMFGILKSGYKGEPWFLSIFCNLSASFLVSLAHHGFNETRYELLKRKFKKTGFGRDSYYETRILLGEHDDSKTVLESVTKEFNLSNYEKWHYNDRYFKTNLKTYSARGPNLRLRYRENDQRDKKFMTAQVTYGRAAEIAQGKITQLRCFTIRKDKFYYILNPDMFGYNMPDNISDIKQENLKDFLLKISDGKPLYDVSFDRYKTHSKETIMASIDSVTSFNNHDLSVRPNFLEFKTRDDIYTLKEAIKYVFANFPNCQQVTLEKYSVLDHR